MSSVVRLCVPCICVTQTELRAFRHRILRAVLFAARALIEQTSRNMKSHRYRYCTVDESTLYGFRTFDAVYDAPMGEELFESKGVFHVPYSGIHRLYCSCRTILNFEFAEYALGVRAWPAGARVD